MEQLLVSPLSPIDVVIGKALPYGGLAVVAAVVLLVTARLVFGLEVRGDPLLLLLVIVLFVAGAQGLGLLISSATTSQQVAFQAATFATMLPALLLSGFIFPIRSMPIAIQALTWLVPARYFVRALRGIVLKGVGLEVIWPQVVALVLFATLTLAGAVARLRRTRL
jgi:ABC-2 type transport system permease protein